MEKNAQRLEADVHGRTNLHRYAIIKDPLEPEWYNPLGHLYRTPEQLKFHDATRSLIVLKIIIKDNAGIKIKDNFGKSPLDYIEFNKEQLPLLYKIFQAAKFQEEYQSRHPLPSTSVVSLEDEEVENRLKDPARPEYLKTISYLCFEAPKECKALLEEVKDVDLLGDHIPLAPGFSMHISGIKCATLLP